MICEKTKCTGCFACYNICPQNCIEMQEDEMGCIYPIINQEKCVKCGLCKKICPQLCNTEMRKPQKAYAMYNKDEEIRKKSTSGGAATTFYMHILNKNGVVYGCSNIENNEIHFIRIDNIDELDKLKGSKYVHSYINNAFKLVEKDLKDNKQVLFIGTPCQVDGLKKFLRKEYDNLILIDIICHGVPSQKLLNDEIKTKKINNVSRVSFRGNDGFKMKIYSSDGNVIENEINESPYYFGFMQAVFYRENCYTCKYATSNRVSDMTIGDFWGLSENSKMYNSRNDGVSVLLPITEKGQKLIDECKKKMVLEERPIQEAINGNNQLMKPVEIHSKTEKFKKVYQKKGYLKACNVFMWKNKVKQRIKNNKTIYKLYKQVKGKKNG